MYVIHSLILRMYNNVFEKKLEMSMFKIITLMSFCFLLMFGENMVMFCLIILSY